MAYTRKYTHIMLNKRTTSIRIFFVFFLDDSDKIFTFLLCYAFDSSKRRGKNQQKKDFVRAVLVKCEDDSDEKCIRWTLGLSDNSACEMNKFWWRPQPKWFVSATKNLPTMSTLLKRIWTQHAMNEKLKWHFHWILNTWQHFVWPRLEILAV